MWLYARDVGVWLYARDVGVWLYAKIQLGLQSHRIWWCISSKG